jgi:hypothetical protein
MASTNDKKPVEQLRTGADRVADVARDVTDKGRELARDVAETTASVVERTATDSMAAAKRMTRQTPWLATTSESGSDVATFWRELVTAQLADNLDAFRKMATARDWQERLSVQSSYISGNIARMAEVTSRCMQLTGAMAAWPLTTGRREASTAR